jgi:hypothetical protein
MATAVGWAAHRCVHDNFTWQMKIDRILKLYPSAIESAKIRP